MTKPVPKTIQRGRDSRTGRFIPVREAREQPSTTTVERRPRRRRGPR